MTPVLIILDGPDASGKTTYAQRFQQLFPGTVYEHLSYLPDNQKMYFANTRVLLQAEAALRSGRSFILDRGWMSENIYSRVYRGGSALKLHVRRLDRIIRRLGGVYVIAAPHPDSAADRHASSCRERSEMYLPGPEIYQVAQLYRDLFFGSTQFQGRMANDYVQSCIDLGGIQIRPDTKLYDIDVHGSNLDAHIHATYVKAVSLRSTQLSELHQLHDGKNLLGHTKFASIVMVEGRVDRLEGPWASCIGDTTTWIDQLLADTAADECDFVWTAAGGRVDYIADLADAQFSFIATSEIAQQRLQALGVPHKRIYDPILYDSVVSQQNLLAIA